MRGATFLCVSHTPSIRVVIHSRMFDCNWNRMHLMTFMQMRAGTGILMRLNVFLAQGVFFNLFFFSYLLSPSTCHSFVGVRSNISLYCDWSFVHCLD